MGIFRAGFLYWKLWVCFLLSHQSVHVIETFHKTDSIPSGPFFSIHDPQNKLEWTNRQDLSLLLSQDSNEDMAGMGQARFVLAHIYTGRSIWCKLSVWEVQRRKKNRTKKSLLICWLVKKKRKKTPNIADTACPFALQPGQGSGDTETGGCVMSGWSGRG